MSSAVPTAYPRTAATTGIAGPDWRGWAPYSIVTGILFVVLPIASGSVSSVGLVQRFAIVLGWGWLALLAYRLRTRLPNVASATKRQVAAAPTTAQAARIKGG